MQLELLTRQHGGGRGRAGSLNLQAPAAAGGSGGGGTVGAAVVDLRRSRVVTIRRAVGGVATSSTKRPRGRRSSRRSAASRSPRSLRSERTSSAEEARAATGKAGIPMPSVLAGQLASGRTKDEKAKADRKALQALRLAMSGALGGMTELLASVVELCETQHPELWQNSAEQLLLNEQLRASQRLVHIVGSIQNDFAGIAPSNLDAHPPEEEQVIPGSVAGGRSR